MTTQPTCAERLPANLADRLREGGFIAAPTPTMTEPLREAAQAAVLWTVTFTLPLVLFVIAFLLPFAIPGGTR